MAVLPDELFDSVGALQSLAGHDLTRVNHGTGIEELDSSLQGCNGLITDGHWLSAQDPAVTTKVTADVPIGIIGDNPRHSQIAHLAEPTRLGSEEDVSSWVASLLNNGEGSRMKAGSITVVISAQGAPGRTRVAVALAEAGIVAGVNPLMIDADHEHTGLTFLLGLTGRDSGLKKNLQSARVDDVDYRVLESQCDAAIVAGVETRVLTGYIPGPNDRGFDGKSLVSLAMVYRSAGHSVIVDTAGVPWVAPRNGGVPEEWREKLVIEPLLAQADHIVVVLDGSDSGVARFVRMWQLLLADFPEARLSIFVAKPGFVSRSNDEIRHTLWSFAGAKNVFFVPGSEKPNNKAADFLPFTVPDGLRCRVWPDEGESRRISPAQRRERWRLQKLLMRGRRR